VGLRIFLTGELGIVYGEKIVREERFPGLQGRIVFALLAGEHARSVSKDELEEELWGQSPPAATDTAIRAIVSKVRSALTDTGLSGDALASAFGAYRLQLPSDAWVDIEAAADAIHRAEPALRDGNIRDAVGFGRAAATISDRPLLTGAEGPWVTSRREQLRGIRLRSLDCLAEAWMAHGDPAQAARDAELAVVLDPFREPSHRLLMRALVALGNRAGALKAYDRLRSTLAEELGTSPSPETEDVYLEILRIA
jgi:DNA-binding SARP family transcriptional activator